MYKAGGAAAAGGPGNYPPFCLSANEGREQEKGHKQIKAKQKGKSIWQLLADNNDEVLLAIRFLVAVRTFTAAESLSGAQLRAE